MPDTKVTAFRFSDEELALLDMIQGHTGIRSRMEALREVLRYYAEAKEIQSPGTADPTQNVEIPEDGEK